MRRYFARRRMSTTVVPAKVGRSSGNGYRSPSRRMRTLSKVLVEHALHEALTNGLHLAILAPSCLRFSHHEQSVVVLVTGQFHDLINVVACLAQALLNALEQAVSPSPVHRSLAALRDSSPFPPPEGNARKPRGKCRPGLLEPHLETTTEPWWEENSPRCMPSPSPSTGTRPGLLAPMNVKSLRQRGAKSNADQTTTVPGSQSRRGGRRDDSRKFRGPHPNRARYRPAGNRSVGHLWCGACRTQFERFGSHRRCSFPENRRSDSP